MEGFSQNSTPSMLKIKDLDKEIKTGLTMIASVKSIHPSGMMQTSTGRYYLPFTIGDETGQTKCTAWQELAKPMSTVLEVGQNIKIIRGDVEWMRGINAGNIYTSKFQVGLGFHACVEIYTADGDTHVINYSTHRVLSSSKGSAAATEVVATPLFPTEDDVAKVQATSPFPTKRAKVNAASPFPTKDDVARINATSTFPTKDDVAKLKATPVFPTQVKTPRWNEKVKVADLTSPGYRHCIELEVLTVGLVTKSRGGLYYQTFLGSDETGKITCSLFDKHCENFQDILQTRARLQLKKFSVLKVNKEYTHWCDNDYKIHVYANGEVTLLPCADGKPLRVIQSLFRKNSHLKEKPEPLPELDPKKVSELEPEDKCPCMQLKVEKLLTDGAVISHDGVRHISFIASDESGEIICTILQPNSFRYGTYFKVGSCFKLYYASVKRTDPLRRYYDVKHPCEVVAGEQARLQFVSFPELWFEQFDPPVTLENLKLQKLNDLVEQHHQLVDFFAVISDIMMDDTDGCGQYAACSLKVVDESGLTVHIVIYDPKDVPPGLEIGAIVFCKGLLVEIVDIFWELVFLPKESSIKPITSNEIKKESDWGKSADRILNKL